MEAIKKLTQPLRTRLVHALYRRAIDGMVTPTKWWHGVHDPSLHPVRMFRIGDCSWQAMDHAHAWGQPGYPALLAQRLQDDGLALHFDDCFVGNYTEVTPELLSGVCKERPDVIIVQIGSVDTMRELLPLESQGISVLRLRVNYHTKRLGGLHHRYVVAPLLRRFGRHPAAPIDRQTILDGQRVIRDWIDQTYPGTPWAVVSHHLPAWDGWIDATRSIRNSALELECAAELGATPIDTHPAMRVQLAGRERETRNATGFDLRLEGHRPAAGLVYEWMETLGVTGAAQPLTEPSVA